MRVLFPLLFVALAVSKKNEVQRILDGNDRGLKRYLSPTKSVIYAAQGGASVKTNNTPTIFKYDAQGNCYVIDTTFNKPAYSSIINPAPSSPPQTFFPNQSTVQIQCNGNYQLSGNNILSCSDSHWIGSYGRCVCPRPSNFCGNSGTDVFSVFECDGDKISDSTCTTYNNINNQVTVTRQLIGTQTSCVLQSNVNPSSCPIAFMQFSIPLSQVACSGLNSAVTRNLQDCVNSCGQNCKVWQFNLAQGLCNTGNPIDCTTPDPSWIGASRACLRPVNWCTGPGQTYLVKDCDGDGILDHTCATWDGNPVMGGRIASMSQCIDNWPNAINSDCPAAFGTE